MVSHLSLLRFVNRLWGRRSVLAPLCALCVHRLITKGVIHFALPYRATAVRRGVAYGPSPRWTNFPRRWSQCGPSVRRAGLARLRYGSRRAGQSCVANRATSRRDAGSRDVWATSMQFIEYPTDVRLSSNPELAIRLRPIQLPGPCGHARSRYGYMSTRTCTHALLNEPRPLAASLLHV